MATVIWRGDAEEIAEVKTVTPADVEADDVFTLTLNGKTLSYTATGNTVAEITGALETLWNDSDIAEFAEVTAADANTHLLLTADNAGIPFTVTSDATGNSTLTTAASVNASGPNCLGVAANWSGGALPANTNDVVFEYSDVNVLYQLDALSAIELNSLTIKQSFTGVIGLPRTNENGDYIEYRPTAIEIGSTTVEIGEGNGDGAGRIRLNLGNTDSTINIHNAGSSLETGIPTVLLTSLGTNTVLNVYRGTVGVAFFAGETATVATLRIGYVDNQLGDAGVICGPGATLTTIDKTGGTLEVESNLTTLTNYAGSTSIGGSATATTINLNGGTLLDRSSGTYTAVNVLGGAVLDLRQSLAAKTITQLNMYKDSSFHDPQGLATLTNGIDLVQCSLDQVSIERPRNRTWSESAIA